MKVMASWKESWSEVAALRTKSGRVLGAAIQKKVKETYTILFKHWWFLALLAGGLIIAQNNYFPSTLLADSKWAVATTYLFFLVIFLSARASVHKKNYSYFTRYILYAIGYGVAVLGVIFFCYSYARIRSLGTSSTWRLIESILVLFPFNYHVVNNVALDNNTSFVFDIIGFGYSAIISFFMFFWLDTAGTVSGFFKSLYNSIKLTVYNLPFVLIVYGMFALLFQMLYVAAHFVSPRIILAMHSIFVVPVLISVLSVFYSKKVHEQFNIYFPVTLVE